MHLHPGPVQFGFEQRCAAELVERVLHRSRGLGQHRPDRTAHLQGESIEGGCTAGERGGRDHRQIPGQHGRPPYRGHRDRGGLGHGVDHHPGQRALAELTAEEAPQELLFIGGGGTEQRAQPIGPLGLRPAPGESLDRRERGVHGRAP